jgi:uncharacterized protein (TIGR02996 family)
VHVRDALLAAQPARIRDPNLDELFAQVLARPDDDAPRLVFADAIGATDAECGEFILLQVAARQARRAGRTPDPKLEAQAVLHLKNFGDVWANGVPSLADAWHFRGGFVEHVELSAKRFITNAQQLFQVAPIRQLTLTEVEHDLKVALAVPGAQQLVALTLKGPASLVGAPPLNRLEVLDLRETEGAREPATKWPRLRSVLMPGSGATDFSSL